MLVMTNWHRKSAYFDRLLNFILTHPFQYKVAIIENLFDRAVCLSHKSFHSEYFYFIRNILFFNHWPQELFEKYIKIRIK